MESSSPPTGQRAEAALLTVAALCLPGCGVSLSSFEPAHVPERGHVQAAAGFDVSYPIAAIPEVIDAAEAVEEVAEEEVLTDDEIRQIAEGGAAIGINPPAVNGHLRVALAPLDRLELSGRVATSGWRAGVRYQLLEQERAGVDLAVGVGFGTALAKPPIESILDVTVDQYSRYNIDVPAAMGRHGSWYRWWLGPRLFYSRTSQEMTLTVPFQLNPSTSNERKVRGSVRGSALYVGGLAGAALGYRNVFVGPELTIVGLFSRTDVSLLDRTEPVDLDTLVIQPAFAVMGEF